MSTRERLPLPLELQYALRGSLALVVEDFTLTSLSEPSGLIDVHPLNDDVRRWVLDGEVVVDEELLSSEARRCSSGFFCLCLPNNITMFRDLMPSTSCDRVGDPEPRGEYN